jgi:hypothetical protein
VQLTWIPASRTVPHSSSHDEEFDDAALMDSLEEGPMLNLLRRRFAADKMYTFCSNMVLSINPYKTIPGLYDNLSAPPLTEAVPQPPHLYTIAGRGYRGMLRTKQSQSILMSGESGAGKTEASKLVVRYLVRSEEVQMRSRKASGGLGAEHSLRLEEAVVRSVPLLESFGNAQTINNINSSRFGKLLKLHYTDAGAVLGATTATFLLEKSRFVQQSAGERNFHIMYMLCELPAAKREQLKLDSDPSTYHYLNQGEAPLRRGTCLSLCRRARTVVHVVVIRDCCRALARFTPGCRRRVVVVTIVNVNRELSAHARSCRQRRGVVTHGGHPGPHVHRCVGGRSVAAVPAACWPPTPGQRRLRQHRGR